MRLTFRVADKFVRVGLQPTTCIGWACLLCRRGRRHGTQLLEEFETVEMKMRRDDHASLEFVVVGEAEVDVSTRRRHVPGGSVKHAQMRPGHCAADSDNRTLLYLAGNGEVQVGKCLPKY